MPLTDSAARTLDSSDVRTYVGKIDPEVAVEVLDDGKWRRGYAYYRQRLDDGWWYHVAGPLADNDHAAAVRALPGSGAQAGEVTISRLRHPRS